MPVPDSAIDTFHGIVADAETAFAGARQLHDEWRQALDYARGLASAAAGDRVPGFENIPDLRRLNEEDTRIASVRQQIAEAQAEAVRRDRLAKQASAKAPEAGSLRSRCEEELRRRGVPESRLNPRIA